MLVVSLPRAASLLAALGLLVPDQLPAQTTKPNIVFLFADDMGWTDVSGDKTNRGNGSDYYRTPNIDALAAAGMSFDNAYSCGPNCAPTRAALISGQYGPRTGMYTVNGSNRGQSQFRKLDAPANTTTMEPAVVTMAETLRKAGYATGHFGKWHLGDDPTRGPVGQGFVFNAGGTNRGSVSGGSSGHFAKTDGSWSLPGLPANGKANQFMADRATDEALAFMARSKTSPFFVYLTHFSVHTPIQAPAADKNFFNGIPKGIRHTNQTYAGMLKNLDDNIGRVMQYLQTTDDPRRPGNKLIANTVVIFYTDNGGVGGYRDAGIIGASEITHQFPLKAGKGSLYEGGIRVPLIVRWDGRVSANAVESTPVNSVDFYPTFASMAGAPLPSGQVLDGENLQPLLEGKSQGLQRQSIFWHFPAYLQASSNQGTWRTTPVSVIRRGDLKLLFYYETRTWELYDLANDIGERDNLASRRPDVVASLGAELRAWLIRTTAARPFFKGTKNEVPWPGEGQERVSWAHVPLARTPSPLTEHVMTAGPAGVLLFGGDRNGAFIDQLWRYDGQGWTALSLATRPAARAHHAGSWDAARARLVVFGGRVAGGAVRNDTWEFDGKAWQERRPATAPPARQDHALAAGSGTLLFGGRAGTTVLADTWRWNGTVWTRLSPTVSPPARYDHGLAHDPATGKYLLFGGRDPNGNTLGDTWQFGGTSWTKLSPTKSPLPRASFGMTWDALRGRIVLWGGIWANAVTLDDTWEWVGGTWVERRPIFWPPARVGAQIAYSPLLRRTVLYGGRDQTTFQDTWEYQSTDVAGYAAFGQGCAGTAGTPVLAGQGLPWLGESLVARVSTLPLATQAVLVFVGGSNTRWAGGPLPVPLDALGMTGCRLLVDPLLPFPTPATAGQAALVLPVPNRTELAGLALFFQTLVPDRGANPFGAVMSNGLQATIGSR